jgi:hypothetical protein
MKAKAIIISGLLLLFFIFDYNYRRKQLILKQNAQKTIGKIVNSTSGYRGGVEIDYEFVLNGNLYTGGTKILVSNKHANAFIGKHFPVVYDSINPKNSMMLIMPSEYEMFNFLYPDSLEWVRRMAR